MIDFTSPAGSKRPWAGSTEVEGAFPCPYKCQDWPAGLGNGLIDSRLTVDDQEPNF